MDSRTEGRQSWPGRGQIHSMRAYKLSICATQRNRPLCQTIHLCPPTPPLILQVLPPSLPPTPSALILLRILSSLSHPPSPSFLLLLFSSFLPLPPPLVLHPSSCFASHPHIAIACPLFFLLFFFRSLFLFLLIPSSILNLTVPSLPPSTLVFHPHAP